MSAVAEALALEAARQWGPAAQRFGAATAATPGDPAAWAGLARTLVQSGRFADALEAAEQARQLAPADVGVLNSLGCALEALGRPDDAVAVLAAALAIRPVAELHYNQGRALEQAGHVAAALDAFDAALRLKQDYAAARHARGMARLKAGDFAGGWPDYEWRWRAPPLAGQAAGTVPRWTGGPVAGRAILLLAEQGFGDTIQFARYAPLLAERGAAVTLAAEPPLVPLLASLPGVAVVSEASVVDLFCPLLSLPLGFGTGPGDIPASVPYLAPPLDRVAAWRQRLDALLAPGLRVGLVWAGSPRPSFPPGWSVDRRRSLDPALLQPILAVPGVRFVSLQKGAAEVALPGVPAMGAAIADFADSAAIMTGLDLVIAVDTAAAHVAGAIGKPVWLLNRFDGCWRWRTDRTDSPWYPTMRIYRQPRPGDWASVVGQVAADLRRVAG